MITKSFHLTSTQVSPQCLYWFESFIIVLIQQFYLVLNYRKSYLLTLFITLTLVFMFLFLIIFGLVCALIDNVSNLLSFSNWILFKDPTISKGLCEYLQYINSTIHNWYESFFFFVRSQVLQFILFEKVLHLMLRLFPN
jgi:hypothetical protein